MRPSWHDVVASLEVGATHHSSSEERAETPAAPETCPEASGRDRLTGLVDRDAFLGIVTEALQRDGADAGFAVLLADVDGFKATNHALGYAAGDLLLQAVGVRLSFGLRRGDCLARFGADEFAVFLGDVDEAGALAACCRMQEALAAPLRLGEVEICPSATIGIALRGPAHVRPEDLLRDADRALIRARTLGRGRAEVYRPEIERRPLALTQLEAVLRRALDSPEFLTHYQPSVAVKTGQVAGFEVLLWKRSGGGGSARR